jgi:type IV fimbrial biogenesis protein FimT
MSRLIPSQAGVTLIELMVGLAILSFLLAVGIPNMSGWMMANKAGSASEFYVEGFKLARAQAIKHNSASRITLTDNAGNGQQDWQVDICFATAAACTDSSGSWSTTSAPAGGDPEGSAGFKSVFRDASALPRTSVLRTTVLPAGTNEIYYTSLGWVDSANGPPLGRMVFEPAPAYASQVRGSAVVVTLAGNPTKCEPTATASDSRACPPP